MSRVWKMSPTIYKKLITIIRNELLISKSDAEFYLNVNRLRSVFIRKQENFEELAHSVREKLSLYKQHLTNEEISNKPSLITLTLRTIKYRINFLTACGFDKIRAIHILTFQRLITCTPKVLKELGILDQRVDVFDTLLRNIPDLTQEVRAHIERVLENPEDKPLVQLKRTVTLEYFSWKVTMSTGTKMEPAEVSKRKTTNLLSVELLAEYMKQSPTIAGRSVDYFLRYPIILNRPFNVTQEQVDLLNQHGLEVEGIYPKWLTLNPDTLKQRINYWERVYGPDFVYSRCARRLIINHTFAQRYLEKHGPMDINRLDYEVGEAKMKANTERRLRKKAEEIDSELMTFLRSVLPKTDAEISEKLKEHPFWPYVTLNEAVPIYDYLQGEDISKDQLFAGLYIVFYSYERVKEAHCAIKESEDFQHWKHHPLIVHYIIYCLEKDSRTNGMGIFT